MSKQKITVETRINAPVEKVWKAFNDPRAIEQWNSAGGGWRTPKATNDLREGGRFDYRMESPDGKEGFNFTGTYSEVVPNEFIAYTIDDGRTAEIDFQVTGPNDAATHVTTTFEAESENPIEMQRGGWQAILDSFKKYVEAN